MGNRLWMDKGKEKYYLLPVVFNMGLLPLIMKMYVFDTNLSGFSWYGAEERGTDLFNYYKQVFFILSCSIMVLLLLWKLTEEKGWKVLKSQKAFVCLAAYGILSVLSALFSKYEWFVVHGVIGQFETIYVLLGYCITAVYSFYFIRDESDVSFIVKGWILCLVPMILLGISQILGHDFYATGLGKSLFMTKEARAAGYDVKLNFETGRVYLSLFNPNYVGVFCILALPVLLVVGFCGKGLKQKLFSFILSVGLVLCMIGAIAKTAFVILPFILAFLVLLLRKDAISHKKLLLSGAVGIIVLIIGSNVALGGRFFEALRGAILNTGLEETYDLQELATEGDQVKIVYKGETLYVSSAINDQGMMGFVLKDETGRTLSGRAAEDQGGGSKFVTDDPRFSDFAFIPVEVKSIPAFSIRLDGKDWVFSNHTGYEGCYFYSPYGRFMSIGTAPSIGFQGHERAFTSRGYIWSRTLPFFKDHLFLGSGPDTFLLEFPQYDYLNRNRFLNGELVSKPHNIYLQMAVQTGGLSALFFIAFYLIYFIQSLRLYWRHGSDSVMSRIGVSLCAATFGYMMIGITADSTINTAPIFWSMMGIGLAINGILIRMQK